MNQQRPTDEDTARVVAWQHGKTTKRMMALNRNGWYHHPRKDSDKITHLSKDPRDDTDAANDLLHSILSKYNANGPLYLMGTKAGAGGRDGWCTVSEESDGSHMLHTIQGISGQPFRYAVVNLALEIMENNK